MVTATIGIKRSLYTNPIIFVIREPENVFRSAEQTAFSEIQGEWV